MNRCEVSKKKIIITTNKVELNELKEHGVRLWRYCFENSKYGILEIGILSVFNGEYYVTGRTNSSVVAISDIIEHDEFLCTYGINRCNKG